MWCYSLFLVLRSYLGGEHNYKYHWLSPWILYIQNVQILIIIYTLIQVYYSAWGGFWFLYKWHKTQLEQLVRRGHTYLCCRLAKNMSFSFENSQPRLPYKLLKSIASNPLMKQGSNKKCLSLTFFTKKMRGEKMKNRTTWEEKKKIVERWEKIGAEKAGEVEDKSESRQPGKYQK